MSDLVKQPVSVIVSMRNSATTIVSCLKGLVSQEYPISEIIVFDNLSTDHSAALVEEFATSCPVQLRLIRQTINGGLAISYNMGAAMATSPLIVFVHSDSFLPTQNELEKLTSPLRNSLDVVAAYPFLLMPEEIWGRFPFWQRYLFSRVAMREIHASCCKFDCVRKDVYLAMGGLNAKRFTSTCGYGGEDSDLYFRLSKIGRTVASTARVIHLHDLSNSFGVSSLFMTRRMLARTYGKKLRFHGIIPFTGKWTFFVKPFVACLSLALSFISLGFGLSILLLFSFITSWRMIVVRRTLLDWRLLLLPFVDSGLVFYETFWFIEGLITRAADAAERVSKEEYPKGCGHDAS